MKEVLNEFIAKYVDSKDPNMKDAATALREQVRLDNLKPIMEVFHATLLHNPSAKWSVIVDKFENSYAKKLYVDIDYFQVIKTNGLADSVGLSLFENSAIQNCVRILPDLTFDISTATHTPDTVWEIKTDQFGYAKFATIVYPPNAPQKAVFIKLKGNNVIAEGATTNGDDNEQKWICEITDTPNYEKVSKTISGNTVIQKFLHSGTFTIKNVASHIAKTTSYLNVDDTGKLIVNTTPKKWVLTMQGMKPSHLMMKNIQLDQYSYLTKSYPTLRSPGSEFGKTWILIPKLPSFLLFDNKTGVISLTTTAPVYSKTTFELTVSNHYGSTSATFTIEVTHV